MVRQLYFPYFHFSVFCLLPIPTNVLGGKGCPGAAYNIFWMHPQVMLQIGGPWELSFLN